MNGRRTAFRPTCPRCRKQSSPIAEHCEFCGCFLLIMPRAQWKAEQRRLRAVRSYGKQRGL